MEQTTTVEMSLDDEDDALPKTINYKVIDGNRETGETATTNRSSWTD